MSETTSTAHGNVENVSAAKPAIGGAIYKAPLGTTLPTDAKSALNDAFESLGYISEDGLKNNNSPENTSVKAWGGDTVLNAQTGRPDTFGFKLLECTNPVVLKSIYGDDNVTGDITTGIAVHVKAEELNYYSWVVDMILKNKVLKRTVIPAGKITELAEIVYKTNDPIGYDVKMSTLPDATGCTHHEYIVKGA